VTRLDEPFHLELPAGRRPVLAFAAGGATVAVATALLVGIGEHSAVSGLKAFVAALIAVAVAGFALTLPGLTWRGVVIGGFFVLAGMVSWTYLDEGWPPQVLLAVEGLVFAAWAWPWFRNWRGPVRLGGSWLGLAYWLLGIVGAVLIARFGVAAQRLAYAGVFGLAILAVVASTRRRDQRSGTGTDLSVGIVGAFLFAVSALLLSGAGNLFDAIHVVPEGGWGTAVMQRRFWGGEYLLYHPNSLAGIAVLTALRIGPDKAFARWQRLAALALCGWLLVITNSRTGFVFAGAAAVVHAFLLWRRRDSAGLPEYRRWWLAAATPFVVLVLVLVASGGSFLGLGRYNASDPTSGRVDTWKQVGVDWVHAGWAEKTFGDAQTSRAVVTRPSSPGLKLTTDNAAVGALRRGGVLGVLAYLVGLALLLLHALPWGGRLPWSRLGLRWHSGCRQQRPAAWFTIAAVAVLPTMATADWVLGGTGGTVWIALLAAEAYALSTSGNLASPTASQPQ
jgi:hypothetical protein